MRFYQWCFDAFKKYMLKANLGVLTFTLRRTDDKDKIHDQWVASVSSQGYKDKEEVRESLTFKTNGNEDVLLAGPDSYGAEKDLDSNDKEIQKKTIKVKIGKRVGSNKRIYPAPIKG